MWSVDGLAKATDTAVAILAQGILELENPEGNHFLNSETRGALRVLAGLRTANPQEIELRQLNPLLRKIAGLNIEGGSVDFTRAEVIAARNLLGT